MKIRFLETVESLHPERPFRYGQIIDVAKPTAEMRGWLKAGRAEVVRETEPSEATVEAGAEHAVMRAARK